MDENLRLFLTILLASLPACPSWASDTFIVATWNLNNLHHEIATPLRDRAPARSEGDYAILRKYAERLDADVVALQEVNGPRAAALVFDAAKYEIVISDRLEFDAKSGEPTDRIYTGFAIRRGVFDEIVERPMPELGVRHTDGRMVRWGTDVELIKGNFRMRALSIHLKSGCWGSLEPPKHENCVTIAAQRAPLEAWIDTREIEGVPFIVAGDFNRAIDKFGQRDHIWQEIDDRDPPGLNLWRLPFEREQECWKGTSRHYEMPVDFIVFNQNAWDLVDQGSFRELDYEPADRDEQRRTPSDHCPISARMRLER